MSHGENNKKTSKNIALFGSSFNPPQLGHLAVLRELVKKHHFDEVWLVPVYSHAFGKELAPFEDRLAMTKLLQAEIGSDCVKVNSIEKDLNKSPSYTFDVVSALIKKNPGVKLSLILGSDTRRDLPKWHRIADLKKMVGFYFVPRAGLEASPFPNVSSTEIREKIHAGQSIDGLTTAAVADYIYEKKLYV